MNKHARWARRILRDHRQDHALPAIERFWGHSYKIADLGGGSTIHGWRECARCVVTLKESNRVFASLSEMARKAYVAGDVTIEVAIAMSKAADALPKVPRPLVLHSWDEVKRELDLDCPSSPHMSWEDYKQERRAHDGHEH